MVFQQGSGSLFPVDRRASRQQGITKKLFIFITMEGKYLFIIISFYLQLSAFKRYLATNNWKFIQE